MRLGQDLVLKFIRLKTNELLNFTPSFKDLKELIQFQIFSLNRPINLLVYAKHLILNLHQFLHALGSIH